MLHGIGARLQLQMPRLFGVFLVFNPPKAKPLQSRTISGLASPSLMEVHAESVAGCLFVQIFRYHSVNVTYVQYLHLVSKKRMSLNPEPFQDTPAFQSFQEQGSDKMVIHGDPSVNKP